MEVSRTRMGLGGFGYPRRTLCEESTSAGRLHPAIFLHGISVILHEPTILTQINSYDFMLNQKKKKSAKFEKSTISKNFESNLFLMIL